MKLSRARRHRLRLPRLHSGRVRARAVFCFVMSGHRAPSSRSGGRRSVSDEVRAPEDMWGPRGQVSCSWCLVWWPGSACEGSLQSSVETMYAGYMHKYATWHLNRRQLIVDFLFIYFEDNQICVNHKKLLTRILSFWSQCLRPESAGPVLGTGKIHYI